MGLKENNERLLPGPAAFHRNSKSLGTRNDKRCSLHVIITSVEMLANTSKYNLAEVNIPSATRCAINQVECREAIPGGELRAFTSANSTELLLDGRLYTYAIRN